MAIGVNAIAFISLKSKGNWCSQSTLTDTAPEWRVIVGAYWRKGPFSFNLRESVYGRTRGLGTTPANGNIDYYAVVGTKFVTDIELGVEPKSGLKVAIGANNLFNVYPDEYPGYIRAQQYALSSTAYISKYPSFSSVGINGGYYYARLTAKF